MGLLSFLGFGSKSADAAEITKDIQGHGLKVENLNVTVAGDTVTVEGKVPDQSTSEKVALCCGNTKNIKNVNNKLTVAEAGGAESTFYDVVAGDTLSKIAKVCYGDASQYPLIFEANKPMLTSPDKIYPGQKLRIPPKPTVKP